MQLLAGIVLAGAAIGGAYQLFQLFAAWRYLDRARRARPTGRPLPPVTVLKPLKGRGVELYQNLASFCRQDYPDYEIVCGVEDPADPALAVLRQVRHDFPDVRIVVAIDRAPGANRKIANLRHMMRHARHDVLVLSDGDIRVHPDYLRTLVAPLADPAVGLTTCLYRGVARSGAPAVLESLFINTDFTPMVMAAQLVEPFEYAFGASIAITRTALEDVGGFAAIADHLADDFELGSRVARAGYRLVLVPYVVDTVLDSATFRDVWRHQLRWARTYRVCRPVSWFCTIVTHATMWGIASLVVTGGTAAGWIACTGAVAARLVGLAGILRLLEDRDTLRRLWLVPLKDPATTLIWGAAFLGRRVSWSGQVLRVEPGGRLLPLWPVSVSSPALERPQSGGADGLHTAGG
jgi:ceramide glucosyltransferase